MLIEGGVEGVILPISGHRDPDVTRKAQQWWRRKLHPWQRWGVDQFLGAPCALLALWSGVP